MLFSYQKKKKKDSKTKFRKQFKAKISPVLAVIYISSRYFIEQNQDASNMPPICKIEHLCLVTVWCEVSYAWLTDRTKASLLNSRWRCAEISCGWDQTYVSMLMRVDCKTNTRWHMLIITVLFAFVNEEFVCKYRRSANHCVSHIWGGFTHWCMAVWL